MVIMGMMVMNEDYHTCPILVLTLPSICLVGQGGAGCVGGQGGRGQGRLRLWSFVLC
jgi:hypothetical protein